MGRILGIDFGEQRIGLALSDPTQSIAGGLQTLRRTTVAEETAALRRIIETEDVVELVVGMPLGMNGAIGVQAELTRRWVTALRERIDIPIITLDERLTSVQAHQTLHAMGVKRRQHRAHVDAMAATLLLQGYLDQQRGSLTSEEQEDR